MKILNLYAGIGGNRASWEGHEVTAVEFDPAIAAEYQKRFPMDTVVVGDAHQYLLDHYEEFDFIWSSPPCPSHSKLNNSFKGANRKHLLRYPDMKLYEEILFLTHFYKGKYVVENVIPYYKPLIEPTQVIDRHLIWASDPIAPKEFHRSIKLAKATSEELALYHQTTIPSVKDARKVLRNMVHKDQGAYILAEVTRGTV